MDPADYGSGAEDARQAAIRHYREVLKSAPPESRDASDARLRIPALELKLDTGQRRFWCFYD